MGVSPGHANLRKAKQKSRKISKEKALVYKAMPFAADNNVPAAFEINDISIVYRLKNIK